MPTPDFRLIVLLMGVCMGADVDPPTKAGAGTRPSPRPLDAATVAERPAPGTVVPGGVEYVSDGRSLLYLKSEGTGLDRVLWRADLSGPAPRVVARPIGIGNTGADISKDEALRRERQRLLDTGITGFVQAENADVRVLPLNSDLFLQRGDGPLERLTETPAPEIDPKLNAAGTKVAFVRENELYVLDLASKKEIQLSSGAADGLSHGLAEFIAQEEMSRFTGFWWSPDGSKIAYQETDERQIPLYTISHDGGDVPSVETHRYPFAGQPNARVRVGIVPVEGGETSWLDFDEPGREFYLARLTWESAKDLLVQRLSRDQKLLRLLRVGASNGQTSVLLEEDAKTWVNLHDDLRVVPGTREFVWSSERTGFRHLELRDKDGDLVRPLTEGEWAVDAVVGLDHTRREVWFTSGKDDVRGCRLYRVSLDGGPIHPVTTEPGTHKVVVAPDGNSFVDTFSDLKRPPVTTIRDRSNQIKSTLGDASTDPRLASLTLVPPELISFPCRDGVTLHGAYYAPRSKTLGEKSPLIVMLYGGPHVQYVNDAWTMTADLRAQYFAERGFAVWKLDNRGSARRGHAFEAALHRNMGSIEVRDQAEGVRFILSKKAEIDAGRVGVTGRSYGGYMTLRCLTEAPEVFHAGVAEAPVSDWSGYDTCYTERYMSTPLENPEGYRRSSVLKSVDRLTGRLLLIHGLIDENVHFRHSARLASALIAARKSFEILPIPEERHSSRSPANRTYEVERLTAFFEATIGRH